MSSLVDLAIQAQGYQKLYESGQLSAADYKELIHDMNIFEQIDATANQLETDVQYHTILMGALRLAEALA